jgi:hypothetical protein
MTAPRPKIASIVACLLVWIAWWGSVVPLQGQPLRRIRFSGLDWWVKSSADRVGPGPNRFSDSAQNVSVDDAGRLHLRIVRDHDNTWTCAEIVSERSFGYGTYRFRIGQVGGMDVNAVLGLFTWSDVPSYHHREIDVEISRWSDAGKPNAQFVVQPYQIAGNLFRFEVGGSLTDSVHEFSWLEESVRFESRASGALLGHAVVAHGVPQPANENVRINLWLNRGVPPSDRRPLEVVIQSFEFVPAGAPGRGTGFGRGL